MKEKIKYIIAMVITSSVFMWMGPGTQEPVNNKQDSIITINEIQNEDSSKDIKESYDQNKGEENNEKTNNRVF